MSRTKRKLRPGNFNHSEDDEKNGYARDGLIQHSTGSCSNNGGCPICEGNRLHNTNKKKDRFKPWKTVRMYGNNHT